MVALTIPASFLSFYSILHWFSLIFLSGLRQKATKYQIFSPLMTNSDKFILNGWLSLKFLQSLDINALLTHLLLVIKRAQSKITKKDFILNT